MTTSRTLNRIDFDGGAGRRAPVRLAVACGVVALVYALLPASAVRATGTVAAVAQPAISAPADVIVGEGGGSAGNGYVLLLPPPTITAISAGGYHTCVRTSDGAAWCWGSNAAGQLGDGTRSQRLQGVRVRKAGGTNLTGVTAISAGGDGSTCARTSDGAAWCWGNNSSGQLGDGTRTSRLRAVRVTKTGGGYLSGVTAISTGGFTLSGFGWIHYSTCARTSDGAAWCWGSNYAGNLGDGTTVNRFRAVRVTKAGGAKLTGVTAISVGLDSTCARTSDGAAWCWGANNFGELGDGSTTDRHRAVRVTKAGGAKLTGVTTISTGGYSSCARTSDGAAWCWGDNHFGQVGDGTTTDRHRAVRVIKSGGGVLTAVTAISVAGVPAEDVPSGHACARTSDGAAWCWGDNGTGQIGDGTTTERHGATRVTKTGGANLTGVTAVSAGLGDSCALASGGAWCWGGNFVGELGDGTTTEGDRAVPVTAH